MGPPPTGAVLPLHACGTRAARPGRDCMAGARPSATARSASAEPGVGLAPCCRRARRPVYSRSGAVAKVTMQRMRTAEAPRASAAAILAAALPLGAGRRRQPPAAGLLWPAQPQPRELGVGKGTVVAARDRPPRVGAERAQAVPRQGVS